MQQAIQKRGLLIKRWELFYFATVIFQEKNMWKLVVGFIIFAGLALYMLSRGGDIDLSGEKHGNACSSNCVLINAKVI